jgi:hypothetical protein
MSVPLIIALNVGAAALLTALLITLMVLPKRLHPHRHPHLMVGTDTATTPAPGRGRGRGRQDRPQRHLQADGGHPVTDS